MVTGFTFEDSKVKKNKIREKCCVIKKQHLTVLKFSNMVLCKITAVKPTKTERRLKYKLYTMNYASNKKYTEWRHEN